MNQRGKSFISTMAGVALVGTLAACGGSDTNTAPTSVSVEPSAPATLEPNSSSTDLDDYADPLTLDEIRERQAIAVAASGCLYDLSKEFVGLYPGLWLGTILTHGLHTGELNVPKQRDEFVMFMLNIHISDYMTESFETAAALDPKFEPLVNIWQKAGNRAIKLWDQGVLGTTDVLNSFPGEIQRLTARCRVPATQASAFAEAENMSLDDWIQETASGLLPEAWDDKEFINMPEE